MEWIKSILEKHRKEDGTIDIEAANKEIDQEFPKNAVPKEQYNNVSAGLKEANKTITSLNAKTQDKPDVQAELATYKTKAEKLESENRQLKIDGQAQNALRAAGAKDVEYAMFKLGNLELDKEGNVKDLESKVKDLQTQIPDYLQAADPKDDKQEQPKDKLNGFQQINPNPGNGKQSEPDITQQMVNAFTSDIPAPPTK